MGLIFWVSIVSICLCGGCILAFFAASITRRQYSDLTRFGILSGVYAVIFWQWWLYADSRLLMLFLLLASVGLGSLLTRGKQSPKGEGIRAGIRRGVVTFSLIIGVLAGGRTALSLLPPFGMWNMVEQTARSPDGRYEATLVYRDGLTFGYYFVALRPTAFSAFNILDYPYTQVTEVAAEGLTGIRWSSRHTLVVEYDAETYFVQQDQFWHDIKITYNKSTASALNNFPAVGRGWQRGWL